MTRGFKSIMASGFCTKAKAAARVHLIAMVLVTRRVVRSGDQGMAIRVSCFRLYL